MTRWNVWWRYVDPYDEWVYAATYTDKDRAEKMTEMYESARVEATVLPVGERPYW